MSKKSILLLGALVALIIFLFVLEIGKRDKTEKIFSTIIKSEPTTFSHEGMLTVKNRNGQVEAPLFAYREAEGNRATTTLIFDELSFCATESGATPCMAMSVTFDVPFNGKNAIVEGTRQDSQVLVRKIYVTQAKGYWVVPVTQSVFISWPQARELIGSCQVEMISQTHALDVYLTLKNGETLRTVEPQIDEIFRLEKSLNGACGVLSIATE